MKTSRSMPKTPSGTTANRRRNLICFCYAGFIVFRHFGMRLLRRAGNLFCRLLFVKRRRLPAADRFENFQDRGVVAAAHTAGNQLVAVTEVAVDQLDEIGMRKKILDGMKSIADVLKGGLFRQCVDEFRQFFVDMADRVFLAEGGRIFSRLPLLQRLVPAKVIEVFLGLVAAIIVGIASQKQIE